ncbi:DAK2 domain-containing protein [Demequina sp. SYSU T00039]|uniref:DAK2 domain-containing protein n=1 Tax=Demequina lignilytica TaxID=3051663 RepID=A0AAW7M3W6_9MICO|nr:MULTISPECIES: DAK2 domain-containing protein [unclassified Demequina]MDN4478351.1 DAK2 domain-containing protein [Demequina sp. SYSU T00039-1]MDN4487142.1 DAK2 domain-containing protein [Demequina sp. SYSU T00039]
MSEAHALRRWLRSGLEAVHSSRGELDAINVFPVADSDTGTNVYLTLQEGSRAIARLPADASHRDVAAAFARGVLMGARGNSGVIVSQYLGALLRVLDDRGGLEEVDSHGIAQALARAAEAAYAAVSTPVEGTILTVARAAARSATDVAAERGTREAVIVAAVEGARAELARTPEKLPSAREAGVVDAGAAALVLQLEMLAETIAGPDALKDFPEVKWELPGRRRRTAQPGHLDHGQEHGGAYEVMFVAERAEDLRAQLIARLEEVGDSVTVTAGHGLVHAHVHTDHPHRAVDIAAETHAHQIVVRSIAMSIGNDRAATGVVALTVCPGLAEPLADAGAVVLVVPDPGALGRRDLARAVRDASGAEAIVVAGDAQLLGAARALAARKGRPRLVVIDASHEAHVIAAVAASALATPGEDVVALMRAAVAATTVADSTGDALDDDLDRIVDRDTDVVTLILGRGVEMGVADHARLSLEARAPEAEVVVHAGGQVWPPVLIGVEAAPG